MNSEVSNTAMRRKNEEDPESDNDGNDLEIDNRDDDGSKRKERRVGKKKRRNLPKDDDMMMMMMAEDGGDEVAARGKRGVCYLSRVPPHMDPSNLRQLLSNFGEILRIYLVPQESTTQVQQQVQRKQSGRFQGKSFTEGWVEFTKKSFAKRVANILNGEQIGGRKRSSFYYDIWNIKYLSKFKWDDLTNEIANKNRTREQKLALEISAAKRERDFYLSKVDQSRALNSMKERKQKKQKTDGVASDGISGDIQDIPKVIRKFPQNRPVDRRADTNKPKLSQDFLAGVFRESS